MARIDYKIFKQLKKLSVSPPPEMWEELRLRLFENDRSDQFKRLKEYEIEPDEISFNGIVNKIEEKKLANIASQLQQYEVAPPAELFKQTIDKSKNKKQPTGAWLYQLKNYRNLLAAAAVVTIIITTVVMVITINKQKANDAAANAGLKNEAGDNAQKGSSVNSNNGSPDNAVKKHNESNAHFFKPHLLPVYSMHIEGFVIPVSDNDLLLSFAEYKPGARRIFLKESAGGTVELGSGTNIAISKYMMDVINDLYQVKRNGKPTWKAKRTKAKILRWRKEDARLFSNKKKNNPLDLIDLADNVY